MARSSRKNSAVADELEREAYRMRGLVDQRPGTETRVVHLVKRRVHAGVNKRSM